MTLERHLAEQAIESDLFGPDALVEVEAVRAPDKYQLIRRLGRGGAGEVWQARDVALERLVALKFLGDVPPSVLERFRREARYAARLKSPSIVEVYAMDEHEGRPFIAMEYVDGGNLAEAQLERRALVQTHVVGLEQQQHRPRVDPVQVRGLELRRA